jgi:hypothetical protein
MNIMNTFQRMKKCVSIRDSDPSYSIWNLEDPDRLDTDPPENAIKFIMSKRENYQLIGFHN